MDRSDMAAWRAIESALLSTVLVSLAFCLTGCDTLQSADSSAQTAAPSPPPSAYHQVIAPAPSRPAPVAVAPTQVSVNQPAEKPVVHKAPETVQTPPVPVRTVEAKPAPPPAPAKGAETLVA